MRHSFELGTLLESQRQLIRGSEHARKYRSSYINATLVTVH
jgi:hypothetical protein